MWEHCSLEESRAVLGAASTVFKAAVFLAAMCKGMISVAKPRQGGGRHIQKALASVAQTRAVTNAAGSATPTSATWAHRRAEARERSKKHLRDTFDQIEKRDPDAAERFLDRVLLPRKRELADHMRDPESREWLFGGEELYGAIRYIQLREVPTQRADEDLERMVDRTLASFLQTDRLGLQLGDGDLFSQDDLLRACSRIRVSSCCRGLPFSFLKCRAQCVVDGLLALQNLS